MCGRICTHDGRSFYYCALPCLAKVRSAARRLDKAQPLPDQAKGRDQRKRRMMRRRQMRTPVWASNGAYAWPVSPLLRDRHHIPTAPTPTADTSRVPGLVQKSIWSTVAVYEYAPEAHVYPFSIGRAGFHSKLPDLRRQARSRTILAGIFAHLPLSWFQLI